MGNGNCSNSAGNKNGTNQSEVISPPTLLAPYLTNTIVTLTAKGPGGASVDSPCIGLSCVPQIVEVAPALTHLQPGINIIFTIVKVMLL
ncbi:MAG: hypothetical protein ABIN94_14915 [Ferruginibacter sp.]